MNKKLIAIDLDGTLLRSDHTVSDRTVALLTRLHDEGHIVVIATGRILSSARATAKTMGLNLNLIGSNGAVAYLPDEDIYIRNTLPKETCYKIMDIFQNFGIYHHFYNDDTVFASELAHTAKLFNDSLANTAHPHVKDVVIQKDLRPQIEKTHIFKFGIIETGTYDFDAVIREIEQIEGIFPVFSNVGLCDIMKEGINKWTAIQKIMERYDIAREDVITFGDSPNDEQMIANAGTGVAMGNACELVRSVSDAQTKTNDEDGVYHYLAEILKL